MGKEENSDTLISVQAQHVTDSDKRDDRRWQETHDHDNC
jgi:hypothetical protein